MAVKFLDLKKQYLGIRAEIDEAIRRVVERGCFVGGEEVEAFENEFSEYLNKNAFCVKTESGNSANLSLRGSEATEAIYNVESVAESRNSALRPPQSANCKDNQQYSITSDRDPLRSSGTSGGCRDIYVPARKGELCSPAELKTLVVANGTDALEIAIEALELEKGKEVLVPANTFVASAEAVVRNGLKIKFVDCNDNYTMDINDLESKISKDSVAILAVHLYGQSADMDAILSLAKKHNLRVIEDCAQAHGAEFKGRRVGGFGDIATFSFYPGKNLGAYGDGGAIVSRDSTLLEKCRKIAHHGGLRKYSHEIIGRNSRLDAIQAAVLRVKLKYLDSWNKRRNAVAEMYLDGLKGICVLPKVNKNCYCVWHLFVVRVKNRDRVVESLKKAGIECGLHYPTALPHCAAFKNKEFVVESQTKNATAWQDEILSLPMGEHLSEAEVGEVIRVLKRGL